MNRAEILAALAQILNDNIGQKLTLAMANGIMTTFAERVRVEQVPAANVDSE